MKRIVLIVLGLVGLLQGCQAAGDGAVAFCDFDSKGFYRRQQTVPWQPVAPERIVEEEYRGRIFETRFRDKDQDLYGYRVFMNIRGKPVYVSVALLDHPQSTIDVKQLAAKAKLLLQNEAMKAARELQDKRAFVSLASNEYDILLWEWRSRWFFSVDAPERFSVFEIVGNTVGYVCTYQQ
jgi:hypothetical protein